VKRELLASGGGINIIILVASDKVVMRLSIDGISFKRLQCYVFSCRSYRLMTSIDKDLIHMSTFPQSYNLFYVIYLGQSIPLNLKFEAQLLSFLSVFGYFLLWLCVYGIQKFHYVIFK
jgi:hypothetical protein